jgi:hypothetical protein
MKKADLQRLKALLHQQMKIPAKRNKLQIYLAKCDADEVELISFLKGYIDTLKGIEKGLEDALKKNAKVVVNFEEFINVLLREADNYKNDGKLAENELKELEGLLKYIVTEKLNMNWEQIKKEYKKGR